MTYVVLMEADGTYEGKYVGSRLSLEELRQLKEHDGRKLYPVTDEEFQRVHVGASVQLIDDVIEVGDVSIILHDLEEKVQKLATLNAKLVDDSITFNELKELMRLKV